VPYHARGENQKGAFGRVVPRLLTPERIDQLTARAAAGQWVRFATDIWPLISKEVRTVYYAALLAGRPEPRDSEAFADCFIAAGPEDSADEENVLNAFGVKQAERWDWQRISRPTHDRTFRNSGEYGKWLLEYLREDVRQAALGNLDGPLKAALDTLRDLRNEVRLLVDHCGLEGDSHQDDLYGWFTPLNAFLSIGPPSSRIEELIALVEAGEDAVRLSPPHVVSESEVDTAERMGLDAIWLAEIHFSPGRSVLSAPLTIASAIAARTQRLLGVRGELPRRALGAGLDLGDVRAVVTHLLGQRRAGEAADVAPPPQLDRERVAFPALGGRVSRRRGAGGCARGRRPRRRRCRRCRPWTGTGWRSGGRPWWSPRPPAARSWPRPGRRRSRPGL
jgi:hypothetical protein